MVRYIICILLSSIVVSCGNLDQPAKSEIQGAGSWSTEVGGSLAIISSRELQGFTEARFYRVLLPVGFGVVHEYIGIRLSSSNGNISYYTTGLVGEGDQDYFERNFGDTLKVIPIKALRGTKEVYDMISFINRLMSDSKYHNRSIYFVAMASTPITGRPCANTAKYLERIILEEN